MEIKTAGDLLTAIVIEWRWAQYKIDGRFFFFSFSFSSALALLARCRIS